MSNQDFTTMTTAQLREYAETVQAEYDADELSGPMGRQIVRDAWARVEAAEAAEAVTPTAAEVIANINTNEAFGVAWGADGQVLTHVETCEAIATGRGWFDRQGRWVNRAGWEKRHAGLGAWVASHLPNDTGVKVSDILTAIWDWRMSNRPTSFRVGCATISVEQVSRTAWDVSIVYDNNIKAPRRVTITNLEMVNTIIGHVTADQEAMKHKENTTAL